MKQQNLRRIALLPMAVLAIAAAGSVSAQNASITLQDPAPGATGVSPRPIVRVELTDGATTVDTNTIALSLDGALVSPTITQSGGVTYVSYTVTNTLAGLSVHTNQITALDNAANVLSNQWTYTVTAYTFVPASWAYPAGSGDVNKRGFTGRIGQLRIGATQSSAISTAEAQLDGLLIETGTGVAFTNMVVTNGDPNIIALGWNGDTNHLVSPGNTPGAGGTFTTTNTINYSIAGAAVADVGNFSTANGYPDDLFPGTPGYDDYTFSSFYNSEELAVEVSGWIELPAGVQRIGVNCDDGFQLSISPNNANDLFRTRLAQNDGNRSAVDSTVTLVVQTNGVYSFRLIFRSYRSTEPCQLEWFTYDESGTNLINDTVVGAVKSYQALTVPTRSYVQSVTPLPGASGVAPIAPISVVLVNATNSTAPVLKVKGATVAYTAVTNGNQVTLSYTPVAPLTGLVTNQITYGGLTNSWTYQIKTGQRALYIVTSGGVPNSSDAFVGSRLALNFGLDVEYADAGTVGGNGGANTFYATNRALIVISSIISSASLPNWLKNLIMTNNTTVPIVNWEAGNADETGFCPTTGTGGGLGALQIVNAPNAISAGLTNGVYTLYTSGSFGQRFDQPPTPGVTVVAFDPVNNGLTRIAYLTNGTQIANYANTGLTITNASRKVFLGLLDNTGAESLNADGLALLDAAFTWALQLKPVLTETKGPGAGQATLSWIYGGTLETTTNLAAPASWVTAPSQSNPQTVDTTADQERFYRVNQP